MLILKNAPIIPKIVATIILADACVFGLCIRRMKTCFVGDSSETLMFHHSLQFWKKGIRHEVNSPSQISCMRNFSGVRILRIQRALFIPPIFLQNYQNGYFTYTCFISSNRNFNSLIP